MPHRYDPKSRLLSERLLDADALRENPESVFAIDREGHVIFVNDGWDRFASENRDDSEKAPAWGVGSDFFAAISEPLRPFYRRLLDQAPLYGRSVRPLTHCYECSSPSVYRKFNMQVYALPGDQGHLIVNSLIVERPHDPTSRSSHTPDPRHYTDAQGLIRQCAHCRRVQNANETARWDWVPAWVARPPSNTSHGLCPVCSLYYFPDEPSPTQAA
jgi:hypothetical protein